MSLHHFNRFFRRGTRIVRILEVTEKKTINRHVFLEKLLLVSGTSLFFLNFVMSYLHDVSDILYVKQQIIRW